VLHFSGADFRCGVRRYDADSLVRTAERLFESFNRLSLAQVVREIDREFPDANTPSATSSSTSAARSPAGSCRRRWRGTKAIIYRSTTPTAGSSTSCARIDSPVPRPLQVAADVAVTHEAVDAAQRLAAGKLDPGSPRAMLLALKQLAQRLGAPPIDLDAVRGPYLAAVRGLSSARSRGAGRRPCKSPSWSRSPCASACTSICGASRTHSGPPSRGDLAARRRALARLAQALWFDETIVLARVAGNRERASA